MNLYDITKYYVYVAAPFPMRPQAKLWQQDLERAGFVVTARWLTQENTAIIGNEWAMRDLEDVANSDCLLALNPIDWAEKGTGGRHVEFGYALALEIPIMVVGERTHIFHHLEKGVTVIADGVEAFKELTRWRQRYLETVK